MQICVRFLFVFLLESVYSAAVEDYEDIDDGDGNSINATRSPDIPTLLSIYAANAHMLALLQRMFGDNKTVLEHDQEQEKTSGSPVVKKIVKNFECKSSDKFACMEYPPTRLKIRNITVNKNNDRKTANSSKCRYNCKQKRNVTTEKVYLKSDFEYVFPEDSDGSLLREIDPSSKNSSLEIITPIEDINSTQSGDFSLNSRLFDKLPKVRQNRKFRTVLQLGSVIKNKQAFDNAKLETDIHPKNISASQRKNDTEHLLPQQSNNYNFTGILNQILEAIKKKIPQNDSAPHGNAQRHSTQLLNLKKNRPLLFFSLKNKNQTNTSKPRQLFPVTEALSLRPRSSTVRSPKVKLVFLLLTSQNTTKPPKLENKTRILRTLSTVITESESVTYKTSTKDYNQESHAMKHSNKEISTPVKIHHTTGPGTERNWPKLNTEDRHVYWTSRPKLAPLKISAPLIPARHRKIF